MRFKSATVYDSHSEVGNNNVTVRIFRPIQDIFWPGSFIRINFRKRSVNELKVPMNDVMVVQKLHSFHNRPDNEMN